MLGLGWFPDSLGGLDRYYRALFERLPAARGVVVGPAPSAPASIAVVSDERASLPRRLLAYSRAARRAGAEADVLDAHFALYALAPLRARALRSLPMVFHFHGPWAQETVAAGDGSRLRRRLRTALERRALRRADVTIVLSSAFRRLLVESYGIAPWEIRVWPPGVALDRFTTGGPDGRTAARARLGLDASAFVVVCARRLVARMGVEHLLDAWADLGQELPPGSTLLIVGDGPLREQLAATVDRSPALAASVRLMGRVDDAELIDAYRAADVGAVPTVAFEGFGLVVLEAAACGTPSIVTDVGGLPEVVAGIDRSLVVPPADARALRERLRAAAGGALPARDVVRAHAERFDWGSLAARHERLYERLAARASPGGPEPRRRRVVYLDHVARLSGGEIALLRLLPHFRRTDTHVILGEHGPLAARLAEAGVSVEVLPIASSARDLRKDRVGAGTGSPAALLATAVHVVRLAARLRRLRPDLVHTNSLKSGVYGALAARLAGVPVVWHLRDRVAEDYLPRAGVRLIRTLIARLADGVVANSTDTLRTVPRAHRNRVHSVVPDSVELSPEQHAPEPGATTFGMLGRIAPWKGQDLFLRAFAQAFPTGAERAVLVGTPMFGEESFEQELRSLAAQLGLAERVEFRGFREDIWRQLAGFDVLVHASVIPEPFGQVVLEGMAAGVAVIAADEGGPAEMVADGHTGRLFASRDQDALAAVMTALRDDPEQRLRLGQTARLSLASYHPDALADQLEALYEQLLGAPPAGA